MQVYGSDVVTLRGPEIEISSKATLALGMAVHELATNAAKYGALSVPDGRLAVSWSVVDEGEGQAFRLVWQESDGPEITAPDAQGFGSTLIASTVERSLGGEVRPEWERGGLRCVIEIPLDSIVETDDNEAEHIF